MFLGNYYLKKLIFFTILSSLVLSIATASELDAESKIEIKASDKLEWHQLENKIVGVLKVKDGNSRALPNAMYAICKKFQLLSKNELMNFKKLVDNKIYNHANKKVGKIITVLK